MSLFNKRRWKISYNSKIEKFRTMIRKEIDYFKKIKNIQNFHITDIGQQIIGALILSAPFIVTQEVWELAKIMNFERIVGIFTITLIIVSLILKFQQSFQIKRLISILIISYLGSFFVLYVVGIIGNVITEIPWALKLVVLVSLFSSIGACIADTFFK